MLARTLSNFMNAFTAPDHTFYPFATTNAQDFKNLMSVYLDATLHPLLKESDFTQEGWRIGPENPRVAQIGEKAAADDSKLAFKGVVYNEMKGQMSDASYLFYIRFQDHIFPSINNAGGDPQKITDLTYRNLRAFHAQHYHPSNAKLITYGDMPLEDHLEQVDAQLAAFEPIEKDVDIRVPIELTESKAVTVKGPIDPLVGIDMQYKTSLSWMMGKTSDILETFSLGIMSGLLMDGYGSPLYRDLIEAGLGSAWSPNMGFDNSGKVGIFSIGLTGVKEADVDKVEERINQTLQEARKKGFEKEKVDGYLHQLELSLKHKTANFGVGLLQRLKPHWFVGVDPFDSLAWNDTVSAFQAEYAKGGFLEGLLEKYLLNRNTFRFTMVPSADYGKDNDAEEATRLARKIADVSTEAGGEAQARAQLEKRELELLHEQAKSGTQDVSCLPSVRVQDIPRQKEVIELRDAHVHGVDVQWREAPTNGLTYFRAINTFENLSDELRALVPLFTDSIMRLGTRDMSMEKIEDLIKLKTGGVNVGYHAAPRPADILLTREGLSFAGTALDRNVPEMFNLLRKIVLDTNFDSELAQSHIKELLQASANGAVNNIASSGHSYAMGYAGAGLTNYGRLMEQVGGLTHVKHVTSLASRSVEQGLADVVEKLKTIQRLAFSETHGFRAAMTCGAEQVSENEHNLEKFLASLSRPTVDLAPKPSPSFSRHTKTFFPLPYQVYYSSLALRTVHYTDLESAPLQVLAQLLTQKHLLHEIREKGGAYGAGVSHSALSGLFSFYSYRDPNPQNTISIIRKAGDWAVQKEFTARDIEEAKISVFQRLDAPKAVSDEGMSRFNYGLWYEMQQERRERLLDVTTRQIKEVAQKYLVEALERDEGKMAFLGERKEWVDGSWDCKDMGVSGSTPAPEAEEEVQNEEDVQQAALGS